MANKTGGKGASALGFIQTHSWPTCDKHLRCKIGKKQKFSSASVADESESGEKHVHKVHPSEMPQSHPRKHHKPHLLKPRGIGGIFAGAVKTQKTVR